MFDGFITKSRLQTTHDDKLVDEFWWEKSKMVNEPVTNFRLLSSKPSNPCFCEWPWILIWSKWIFLADIPAQILLTIMGYIDHSSRCKLDVYIIAHTKEKPCTTNDTFCKICKAMSVKRVSKIWLKMSIATITSIQKF